MTEPKGTVVQWLRRLVRRGSIESRGEFRGEFRGEPRGDEADPEAHNIAAKASHDSTAPAAGSGAGTRRGPARGPASHAATSRADVYGAEPAAAPRNAGPAVPTAAAAPRVRIDAQTLREAARDEPQGSAATHSNSGATAAGATGGAAVGPSAAASRARATTPGSPPRSVAASDASAPSNHSGAPTEGDLGLLVPPTVSQMHSGDKPPGRSAHSKHLNDNASVMTIASSTKRRRQSFETNISTHALPAESLFSWHDSADAQSQLSRELVTPGGHA